MSMADEFREHSNVDIAASSLGLHGQQERNPIHPAILASQEKETIDKDGLRFNVLMTLVEIADELAKDNKKMIMDAKTGKRFNELFGHTLPSEVPFSIMRSQWDDLHGKIPFKAYELREMESRIPPEFRLAYTGQVNSLLRKINSDLIVGDIRQLGKPFEYFVNQNPTAMGFITEALKAPQKEEDIAA